MGRVLQERNQLKTKVTELKRENANLQKKLSRSIESLKPADKPPTAELQVAKYLCRVFMAYSKFDFRPTIQPHIRSFIKFNHIGYGVGGIFIIDRRV